MPIGDLLASISGEEPASPTSTTVTKTARSTPKRKADEDLNAPSTKTPRTGTPSGRPPRQISDSSTLPSRPSSKLRVSPATSNPKSSSAAHPSARSAFSSISRPIEELSSRQTSTSTAATKGRDRSNGRLLSADGGLGPEPKKRSFAEIMARAKAAQATVPTFGRIQHKTLDRGLTKKERQEAKAEGMRKGKRVARPGSKGGSTGSSSHGGPSPLHGRDSQRRPDSADSGKPVNGKGKKAPTVEEKKPKKAALATTGYTGTARTRVGRPSPKPNGSRSTTHSAATPHPRDKPRYGGALSGSRQYEEEDDDMDDFIEYDEEEEPGYGRGHGGRYNSADEESDMEAGMSDIDQEERRAEYHARREDQEEEALERRLKRDKEERKRRLLEAVRNRTR